MAPTTATPTAPYYVFMHDTFMSNWGHAKGKHNVFVIACETWDQATAIAQAATERKEMRRVRIDYTAPRAGRRELMSCRTFAEMGGKWLTYYNAAEA